MKIIILIIIGYLAGTLEERGMSRIADQTKSLDSKTNEDDSSSATSGYDFPFGMAVIRRLTFLRYLPISPTHGQPRHRCRDTVAEQHTNEGCADITNVA